MDFLIQPGKPLMGEIDLPGDKSISHRAALFAALAQGDSRIANFLDAGVTRVMLNALQQLGITWQLKGHVLSIQGIGLAGLKTPTGPLDCGSSGTTLRLLAGALTAANLNAVLDGSPGLRRRPMKRVVEPLRYMGAVISASDQGTAPLKLSRRSRGSTLYGREHHLQVASAQVKTALLLAGLRASGPTTVIEPHLSRDHTERMLAGMGVSIHTEQHQDQNRVKLQPPDGGGLTPLEMLVPGDFSSAAFLIVAALITPGSEILLKNVGLNPTRTGLLEVLKGMGANLEISRPAEHSQEPAGDLLVRHSPLHGLQVSGDSVVRMIDEFPVFAVAAAYADGETTVTQARELRYKESDRIASVCAQLAALGVETKELEDGFIIKGGQQPLGGTVMAHGDHRLAMSLAVCGLGAQQVTTVRGAEIYQESFPEFGTALTTLGANLSYE